MKATKEETAAISRALEDIQESLERLVELLGRMLREKDV